MENIDEKKIRRIVAAFALGYGVGSLNPVVLFVSFLAHIYHDIKHPAFDSKIEDKNVILKPWERGY